MGIEDREAEFNELRRREINLLEGADGVEPRDPIRRTECDWNGGVKGLRNGGR